MPILSNLIVRIGASTDEFDKVVDRSLSKVKRFAADVTAAGTALSIGFSAPLIAAGAAAIKAGSDMESLTMGLKAVMKSSEATATEMAKLREVAKLPGLGLEEAVKGTIRLQILGNSADQSRRIMGELGNALAVVGGGREDFNEVIRQLSQLGAVGKVTKENLDPIIERIPQLAAIIKEKFGAEALGDPAKTFERLGISSQQFIQIITDELAKGERAGNTYKNSWENIQMAAKDAAAEFGKTLLPIAQRVLDDFLTPGIDKAKDLAKAFQDLPEPTQNWALALGGIVTATPLVITGMALMIEKTAVITGAVMKMVSLGGSAITWLKAFAGGLSVAGLAAGAAAAGVGVFLKWLIDHGAKPVDTTAQAIGELNSKLGLTGKVAGEMILPFGLASEGIIQFGKALPPVKKNVIELTEAQKKAAEEARKAAEEAYKHSFAGLAEAESTSRLQSALKAASSAWLDYNTMHDLGGKKMAEMRSEMGWLTEASKKYADSLKSYGDSLKALMGIQMPTPIGFPELPNRPFGNASELGREAAGKLGIETESARAKRIADLQRNADILREANRRGDPNVSGNMVIEAEQKLKKAIDDTGNAATKAGKAQTKAMQQVSLVVNDLAKGITDVIFKGGKLGDMFKNVAMQAAQSITRLLIEGALTKLTSKLLDVGGLMGKVFGGATSVGGSVFSAASSAGGSVAGAAGSAAGGVSGAASAVGSSLAGVVGAVGSVVSAVSGIIGNFQMAGMNKTLDLIEKEARYSQIHLLHILEKGNEFWPYMKSVWESLIRMEQRQMAVGAGGGASVVINLNGGDPKAALEEITRTLKQFGVIPRG